MSSYGLPVTGATSIAVGGLVFDQVWLIALGTGVVLAGAMLARFGFRRDKTPQEV